MLKYARVENNVVVETINIDDDVDISQLYHPSIVFVQCGESVVPGYTYDGETFTEPVAIAFDLQSYAYSKLMSLFASVEQFIGQKPDGSFRYNNFLMFDLLSFMAVYGYTTEPASLVYVWINEVKNYMLSIVAAINSAGSKESIDAVDVSYQLFESLYGVDGSAVKDPNITMLDLALARQTLGDPEE